MHRREFVRSGAALCAGQLFPPARVGTPGIIDVSNRKQLFLDDLRGPGDVLGAAEAPGVCEEAEVGTVEQGPRKLAAGNERGEAVIEDLKYEMEDEEPKSSARIRVVGIGGCGQNAVAHMMTAGLEGAEFYVLNTDFQALGERIVVESESVGTEHGSAQEIGGEER